MGTVIGLVILAAIDWYLFRKTGLHIHKWISKKYAATCRRRETKNSLFLSSHRYKKRYLLFILHTLQRLEDS